MVAVDLDRPVGRQDDVALYRRIYDRIRDLILGGRLAPGTRLPASRALATELGCSRTSVLAAFAQLHSEGYIEGRKGSGTFVSGVLPEQLLSMRTARTLAAGHKWHAPDLPRRQLSRRGEELATYVHGPRSQARAFISGVPELRSFPFDVWARLLGRTWRRPKGGLPRHGDAAGQQPLREAIAEYLRVVRAVRCDWQQVLITTGAQQAVDLAARLLLDPGDAAWIEEPGYPGLRGPLIAAGIRLVPVPVDDEGISVTAGQRMAPRARLAVVAPSHQYPLGIVMWLARRLELLAWARAENAWIIEDDFDSEYRYSGRPLAALQGLDAETADGGRVLYVGSFSKVLFPSLRIGYVVLPPNLVEPMMRARAGLDDHPSAVAQPALAAFMSKGHFAAHVRRMRTLYAARQAALVTAAGCHLRGLLEVPADEAGLHLVARLTPGLIARMDDKQAAARAHAAGVTVRALSSYYLKTPTAQGLLLGYAAVSEGEITRATAKLAAALSKKN
ncbi:MAG: MocR-like pyridoxine biosynthesis transcription factor PdxR [Alphaproteobacteria bacterium]